jgi:DNA-directed RNA polymerase subunit RPC12/RpoP
MKREMIKRQCAKCGRDFEIAKRKGRMAEKCENCKRRTPSNIAMLQPPKVKGVLPAGAQIPRFYIGARRCVSCKEPFSPKRTQDWHQRYCNPECRSKYLRESRELTQAIVADARWRNAKEHEYWLKIEVMEDMIKRLDNALN